jgi:hypothetical protein
VNEPAQHVMAYETDQPQNEQCECNCIKHIIIYFFGLFLLQARYALGRSQAMGCNPTVDSFVPVG